MSERMVKLIIAVHGKLAAVGKIRNQFELSYMNIHNESLQATRFTLLIGLGRLIRNRSAEIIFLLIILLSMFLEISLFL